MYLSFLGPKDICQTLRLWFTFIHICTHIQLFLCFRIKKENVFCKKKICYLSATKMKIYSPLLLLLLLPTLSILFWSSYHHLYRLPRPLPPPHRLVIALVLPRAKPPTATQSWWRLFFFLWNSWWRLLEFIGGVKEKKCMQRQSLRQIMMWWEI